MVDKLNPELKENKMADETTKTTVKLTKTQKRQLLKNKYQGRVFQFAAECCPHLVDVYLDPPTDEEDIGDANFNKNTKKNIKKKIKKSVNRIDNVEVTKVNTEINVNIVPPTPVEKIPTIGWNN